MEKEEIQSNTCEIIKVDKMFIKDVEEIKKEYLRIKEKIIHEITQELTEITKDVISSVSDPSVSVPSVPSVPVPPTSD